MRDVIERWVLILAFLLVFVLLAGIAFADHYTGEMAFLNDMAIVRRIKCFEKGIENVLYRCESLLNPMTGDVYVALFHDNDAMRLFKVWKKDESGWTLIFPPAVPSDTM